MSDPLASAQDFAQFIGVSLPTDLARMQQLLGSASAAIRRYAGQTLSPVTGDIYTVQPQISATSGQAFPLPAAYGEVIFLPQRPVTAVSSVVTGGANFTSYSFTSAGLVYRTDGNAWTKPTTVTYDHGYAESSDEYATIKTICMEVAARAYTLNERSASEFLGSTLAESAGYAPEVFLTPGEKAQLEFGRVYVG